MVRVKICGITNREDALKAASLGAWALGFNFYKKSPRFIAPAKAKKIIQELPPFVTPVGIFVNQPLGAIRDIISHCNLGAVQMHGDEDHHFCHRLRRYGAKVIKVFRVGATFDPSVLKDYHVDAFLFDTLVKSEADTTYGGSGKTFNWSLLKEMKGQHKPFILSGGLNPQNVIEPVNQIKPYAVDVASGVESEPGKKDPRLLKEFIEIVSYVSGPNVKSHVD
ncbi:MAG: phosphoribosylanthranilate isomerase [Candidatus Omnitrophica bacterium]|nr:phosphoribosylanthranilate isomerase [Candidatus Omnitrophota bacterium]